jgi:molybdopterin molybdotransferase
VYSTPQFRADQRSKIMIALEEVLRLVCDDLVPLSSVEYSVADAIGCVSAREVVAREALPGFSNSSMDGFALRAVDTSRGPTRLTVVDTVLAGDVPTTTVNEGEAVRVMTGAPLPDGADCVCMIEETTIEADGRSVMINRSIGVGQFVRRPGDDVTVGQSLIASGEKVTPTVVGVARGQGLKSLHVHPRPRVGVMSTGHELVDHDGPLPSGKIRDINRPMLLALLRDSGFTPVDLGIVEDDVLAIRSTFERGCDTCHAVVSTGGVSVGDVDFVKTALAELCGSRARSMQVAMRPGKPFTFATAGSPSIPLFGLAGNPVSTLVGFEMFVRPALRRLAGHRGLERPRLNMVLDCDLARNVDGRLHLVHVVARIRSDGRVHVERALRQGSHLLSAVTRANALVMVPDGEGLRVGETVAGILLEPDDVMASHDE